MEAKSQPLTNLQLEILKTFSHQLSDEDLKALRKLIADFFAERAISEANKVWDEEKWGEGGAEELLKSKLRTPYKK